MDVPEQKIGHIGLTPVRFNEPTHPCHCPDCPCSQTSTKDVCFDCRYGRHETKPAEKVACGER